MSTVRWISHRGYKDRFTENTKEAFQAAIDVGFTSIETDLRLTKDKQIVLSHDKDLQRLTGKKISIEASTRAQLKAVQLPCSSKLYFLDELLRDFPDIQWTFDIKPNPGLQTSQKLIELLQAKSSKEKVEQNICFIPWGNKPEQILKKHFPQARYYASKKECWRAGLCALFGLKHFSAVQSERTYSISYSLLGAKLFRKRIVKFYHKQNAKILAFLPRNLNETNQALNAEFDEILTDLKPVKKN